MAISTSFIKTSYLLYLDIERNTYKPTMPPSGLSYGLNLPNKKQPPGGQKRKKTLFDDSDDEDSGEKNGGEEEITTIGGLGEESSEAQPPPKKKEQQQNTPSEPPSKRKPFFTTTSGKPGAKPLSKNSIFADDEEDEDGNVEQQQGDGGFGLPLGLNTSKSKQQKPEDPSKNYTNLSALHSSKKHAQEAQELDPSIYSYDAVYDSLHAAKPDKSKSNDKSKEVPKYMTSLLQSAEVRKRDQLRARDRMLAREREAEGDEFADKEKFVTGAYKAQQEELRRVEQEDAEREKQEEERRRQNGNMGMVGFYRDMLSRGEERHEEVRKAAEEAAQRIKSGEIPVEEDKEAQGKEKTDTQRAEELNAHGAHIALNDEGQVVDKRQLLSAGLNVAPKPKPAPSAAAAAPKDTRPGAGAGPGAGKPRFDPGRGGQRARQTEMIAAQLEERARQEAAEEEAKQKEVAERNRSQKSAGEVSSARERFLARKREREAQAGK